MDAINTSNRYLKPHEISFFWESDEKDRKRKKIIREFLKGEFLKGELLNEDSVIMDLLQKEINDNNTCNSDSSIAARKSDDKLKKFVAQLLCDKDVVSIVKENAAREKAAREKAAREEAAREKAAREEAAREEAAREKAEKAARE